MLFLIDIPLLKVLEGENYGLPSEALLKHAFDLPSYRRYLKTLLLLCFSNQSKYLIGKTDCGLGLKIMARNKVTELNWDTLVHGLSELKNLQNQWSTVLLVGFLKLL